MTPLEAAAEKAIPRERGSVTPLPHDIEMARAIITAFLDAAARSNAVCRLVWVATNFEANEIEEGRAAILELKALL